MSKLRNVLEDDMGEDVCLKDVINAFVGLSKRMSALEYNNTAHTLREAKVEFRAAERIMLEFKVRLKGPITEEVILYNSKIDKRVVPDNFKKNKEWFGD
jgi:hypothetical protein